MGTAQQSAAHHGTQVVGVLNAIAQHQERRLALGFGRCQQVLHGGIRDLAGKGGHTLMALGAGHQAQLVGVHPLDGCPGLLGQCGIVGRHGGGHALRNEHRIHAGTALQQLGHRILAVDQALIPGLLFRCTARAAGLIFLFHSMFSFRFYRNDAAHVPQGAPHRLRRQPARRFYPMIIQGKV